MKIIVKRRDGREEVLTLLGEWAVNEGKILNRLTNSSGFDHFFTLAGMYDGWSTAMPEGSDMKLAKSMIAAVEEQREIAERDTLHAELVTEQAHTTALREIINKMSWFLSHKDSCEVEQTDVCTCGMVTVREKARKQAALRQGEGENDGS